MESNTMIQELVAMRNNYEQEKIKLSTTREFLIQKKKEIYNQILDSIKNEIDSSTNQSRLQKYLENTYIKEFDFLYRSLNFMAGNNQKGDLSFYKLLFLDENVKKIGMEYGITSLDELHDIFLDYMRCCRKHPFFENEQVNEVMLKVPTLAYLDEIFKNVDNVLAYQGAFTTYQYVKRYLKEVLKEGCIETDKQLVYKDYCQKKEYVISNLSNIASYLLSIREQIPDSRLAICNQGLSRTSKKVAGTNLSFDQKVFICGIAFGTTLKKLQNGNYEDAQSLIYIPHQKLLK